MLSKLKHWIAPPVFADDEQTRRAALLNSILWAMLGATLLATPLLLIGPPGTVPSRVAAISTIVVLVLSMRQVLRRGHVGFASAAAVGGLWVIVTAALVGDGGGVRSLGFSSYFVLVLVAGLLLGKRLGTAFAVLSVLIGLVFVYGRSTGVLNDLPRPNTDLEIWIADSVFLLAAAALLYLALDSLDRALKRARQELAERQQAEAHLRQLTRAVEQSSASIVITDTEGAIQYVNPRFTQVSGYTLAEVFGQNSRILKSGDKPREEYQRLWQTIGAGGEWRGEFHNRKKNGELYWESALISPVLDANGAIVNYVAVKDDITARKQTDEALAAAQSFLKLVVDTSPSMIFVKDRQGRAVFVNQYTADYYGATPEEMVSKSTGDVHRSAPEAQEFESDDQEVIRTQRRIVKEELNTAPNGEQHWFHTVKVPLVRPDGTVDVLGISTDITDRKQHERELQVIATLSAALRRATTIPQMLAVVLEQILSLLSVAAATVEMVEPETGDAFVELGYGPWQAMVGQRIRHGSGLNSYIQSSGQPYVNNNVISDPRTLDPALYRGYHAAAGAPMTAQGQIIGFLWIGHQNDIRDGDVRLLVAIADIAANAIRRAALHAQTEERARRLAALHDIDRAITSSLDLNATLNLLAGHVTSQLQVDAAVILLLNPVTHALAQAVERGPDGSLLPQPILRLGERQASSAVREHRLVSLPDLNGVAEAFAESLIANGFQAYFAAPLLAKGKVVGVLEVFHQAPLKPDPEWLNFLTTLAGQAAVAIENSALIENLQRSNLELSLAYDATIEGWSRALDLRDRETEGHSQRVAELTLRLSQAMNLDPAEGVHIRRGALLHDMGKLAIPDHILLKPAALTPDEWEIMRQHPDYAYQMLAPIDYLRPVLDIPYCHHEKWDGTGYPRGLAGEQIPLAARMFAVVDVWDALRSNRPYRPGWTAAEARDHIRAQAGKHFDPAVVEIFLNLELPE